MQPRFLGQNLIVQTDIEAAFGQPQIVGNDDVDAFETGIDGGGRFDRLVHGLQRRPGAGVPRHRPAIETVIEHFLDPRRIEDGDHHVDKVIFGLVGGGRRFRGMVVAHQG